MQPINNELERYLHELAADATQQKKLQQAVQMAEEDAISDLFVEHAAAAGFSVEAGDVDALIQEIEQLGNNAELSDEALDQVNGGIFLTAAFIIGGSALGFIGSAIGGVIKNKA